MLWRWHCLRSMHWFSPAFWKVEPTEYIYLFIQLHSWGHGINYLKYKQLKSERADQDIEINWRFAIKGLDWSRKQRIPKKSVYWSDYQKWMSLYCCPEDERRDWPGVLLNLWFWRKVILFLSFLKANIYFLIS